MTAHLVPLGYEVCSDTTAAHSRGIPAEIAINGDTMRNRSLIAFVFVVFLTVPFLALAQTFGYFGQNGPTHWASLSAEWVACGTGTIQSPVNFVKVAPHLPGWRELDIDYANTTGEIFNNGHTIEVETEGANTLTL